MSAKKRGGGRGFREKNQTSLGSLYKILLEYTRVPALGSYSLPTLLFTSLELWLFVFILKSPMRQTSRAVISPVTGIKAGKPAFKARLGVLKKVTEALPSLIDMGWLIRGLKALGNVRSLVGYGMKQEGIQQHSASVVPRHTTCQGQGKVLTIFDSKHHQNRQHWNERENICSGAYPNTHWCAAPHCFWFEGLLWSLPAFPHPHTAPVAHCPLISLLPIGNVLLLFSFKTINVIS